MKSVVAILSMKIVVILLITLIYEFRSASAAQGSSRRAVDETSHTQSQRQQVEPQAPVATRRWGDYASSDREFRLVLLRLQREAEREQPTIELPHLSDEEFEEVMKKSQISLPIEAANKDINKPEDATGSFSELLMDACAICLENFSDSLHESRIKLPCNHELHLNCAREWSKKVS